MTIYEINLIFFSHIYINSSYFISLVHLLKKPPELLKCDLPITVLVQLVHQGLQLLLAHVAAQLAELSGIYGARVVFVNSLWMIIIKLFTCSCCYIKYSC